MLERGGVVIYDLNEAIVWGSLFGFSYLISSVVMCKMLYGCP